MTENQYNKLFTLMTKKFDLFKKQTTADVYISKGEIQAIDKSIKVIQAQIKGQYLEKQRKLKSYKDDNSFSLLSSCNSLNISCICFD